MSESAPLIAAESSSNIVNAPSKEKKKLRTMALYVVILLLLLALSIGIAAYALTRWTPQTTVTQVPWRHQGITYTGGQYCPWVKFDHEKSDLSLSNLASTGANYVSLVVTQYQRDINSTSIYPTKDTATDEELKHAIRQAHSLGLQVLLKPHVDLENDQQWRSDIGKHFREIDWISWFNSYAEMITHYATLAQSEAVESFSLGSELVTASVHEIEWRYIADLVTARYSGNITYCARWGGEETNLTWWDRVNFIGVNAFYPLAFNVSSPTVDTLVQEWEKIVNEGVKNPNTSIYMSRSLKNLALIWNKPISFTEVGYCSGQCSSGPNIDIQYQTDHYQALFNVFWDIEWFFGAFWWNWSTDPAFGGEYNYCSTPQFKPAEQILRVNYGGSKAGSVEPEYPPVCPCIGGRM